MLVKRMFSVENKKEFKHEFFSFMRRTVNYSSK